MMEDGGAGQSWSGGGGVDSEGQSWFGGSGVDGGDMDIDDGESTVSLNNQPDQSGSRAWVFVAPTRPPDYISGGEHEPLSPASPS